jgi:hypothetical protein
MKNLLRLLLIPTESVAVQRALQTFPTESVGGCFKSPVGTYENN